MSDNFCKSEAVVLSSINFGDSNKVVTFFTKNFGKIDANAYNCRRPKNHLAGAMQMFNLINLEFIKSNPYKVIDADIINFHNINENLEKLTYASIFFEIVNKMSPLEQIDENIFNLIKNSISAFNSRNPRITSIISTVQFLNFTGFFPDLNDNLKFLHDFINFDWHSENIFSLKNSQIVDAENFLYNYIQSILNSPLNSLKFLNLLNSFH